jgi:hypothetical protein
VGHPGLGRPAEAVAEQRIYVSVVHLVPYRAVGCDLGPAHQAVLCLGHRWTVLALVWLCAFLHVLECL